MAKIHRDDGINGGDSLTVDSGGTVNVSGTVNFLSGAVLQGTATAATFTLLASATTATASDANTRAAFAAINSLAGVLIGIKAAVST